MEAIELDRIYGILSAQNKVLTALWATLLARATDPEAALKIARDGTLDSFDLPSVEPPSEQGFRTTQHALAHLEEFWEGVAKMVPRGERGS